MKPNKRTIGIFIFSAIYVMIVSAVIWCGAHPTYWKYCDRWIIGRNISEVEKRYGKFDLILGTRAAYYIYYDGSGIFPDHLDHYYYMCYDENGIVYKVYDACQPGG